MGRFQRKEKKKKENMRSLKSKIILYIRGGKKVNFFFLTQRYSSVVKYIWCGPANLYSPEGNIAADQVSSQTSHFSI